MKERVSPFPTFSRFDLQALIEEKLKLIGVFPKKFIRTDRPRDRLYASELGGCARSVWHSWRHPRPHDDSFDKGRGALGHAAEEMLAPQLEPLTVAREVSFTNTKVSGRVDFVLHVDGEQIPLELKSTFGFDLALAKPYPSNVYQACWYAQQMRAPYALLCYLNLGNWGGKTGMWATLKIPRMDKELEVETERLWEVVHQDVEPSCENPGDCFLCGLLEKIEKEEAV